MQNFRILSEIDVECLPSELYAFVTTPDNWAGSHPATKGVKGETDSPRGLGSKWIEIIEAPGSGRRFEAQWLVVREEAPRVWEIKAIDFGGLPATVTITYLIEAKRSGPEGSASAESITHFKRDMVTSPPDDFEVSESLRASLTSRESHDQYLRAIKRRIDESKSNRET
ncbi:MAG TPA: hypothetical protein VFF30_19525 [Nitrososphaerales archaeon]|nr:hypothetical protein [Nitrososphaerales archaeon]